MLNMRRYNLLLGNKGPLLGWDQECITTHTPMKARMGCCSVKVAAMDRWLVLQHSGVTDSAIHYFISGIGLGFFQWHPADNSTFRPHPYWFQLFSAQQIINPAFEIIVFHARHIPEIEEQWPVAIMLGTFLCYSQIPPDGPYSTLWTNMENPKPVD